MALYAPFNYILPSKRKLYEEKYDTVVKHGASSLKQIDREKSLQTLMRVNLLKRLESSVDAFRLTLSKMLHKIENILDNIESFEKVGKNSIVSQGDIDNINFDDDSFIEEEHSIGYTVKINLIISDNKPFNIFL